MTEINLGTVLIVDDDSSVRRILRMIIEKSGYEVHPFENGRDALSFLVDRGADLVLTDIRMPGMNGMELLDEVLALHSDTPVILISGYADMELTIAAVKHGAFDFIIKPYDHAYLLKALEKGVTYGRLRKAERTYRYDLERAVEERSRELNRAHELLRQSEKMALVGQIAAGVAHEINNPLGYVSSNLESLSKFTERLLMFLVTQSEALECHCPAEELARIEELRIKGHIGRIATELPLIVQESQEGIERIKEIVRNLKSFSRVDGDAFVSTSVNETMHRALNMVRNEIKYVATIVTDFGEIPHTRCLPNQLTQVFMNLLVNAAQSIEGHGEILVRTWLEGDGIFVAVRDTGCGMPEEVKSRIFEPFFTTKEIGKGTGLGLAISYDIVHKHAGEIAVESTVGQGTTFTIRLPVTGGS